MSQDRTILLLIPHLREGGAARVTTHLARGLTGRGFQVHLACITDSVATPKLPPEVQVHCLGASRVRTGAVRVLRLVRRLQPDVVLSGMVHLNLLVLLLRPLFPAKTRVLVRPNGVMAASLASSGFLARKLFRPLHARADGILCQTDDLAAEYGTAVRSGAFLHVLPNPVDVQAIRVAVRKSQSKWRGPGPHLLAVGRLAHEKGFDLLLQAFATVRAQFPEANLAILGDGPELARLRALAAKLRLVGHVRFEGQTDDPHAWFSGASAFVLPSRHDAMPNALLEAAAAGLPLVVTPSAGGVPALLRGQPGVWMANDISPDALAGSLTAALLSLSADRRFAHSWIETFDSPRALALYDEVIRRICESRDDETHCVHHSRA